MALETLAYKVQSARFPDDNTLECKLSFYAVRGDRMGEEETKRRTRFCRRMGVMCAVVATALAVPYCVWSMSQPREIAPVFVRPFATHVKDGKLLAYEDYRSTKAGSEVFIRAGSRIVEEFGARVEWQPDRGPAFDVATGPLSVLTVSFEGKDLKIRVDNNLGQVSDKKVPLVPGSVEDVQHRAFHGLGDMPADRNSRSRQTLVANHLASVRKKAESQRAK